MPDTDIDTDIRDGIHLGPLKDDLFFVVRNLQAALRTESDAIRAALGLENGVIGLLSVVWMNPGISQNDLAASLALKKSSVTRLVTRLEGQGLVAREKVDADRRVNALMLTADGHALIARARELTDAVHARVFDGIPPADRATFFRVAAHLSARLSPPRDP